MAENSIFVTMIIDTLAHANRYIAIHTMLPNAIAYLRDTDLATILPGKYPIQGDSLFAIVQEYDTLDPKTEQMEAHKKYIDVQYMVSGSELVGHSILQGHTISKPYSAADDYLLVSDAPDFYTKLSAGNFMIFFPTDLHMPCLMDGSAQKVKKVVIKVAI